MAIIGTYNGASIIAFPVRPAIKQLQLDKNDSVANARSPFTGVTQFQSWPGADFWTASLTLPQMTMADMPTWSAFLGECRGALNCFYISDPLRLHPKGSPQGLPVVSGGNVPMSTTLNTRGWKPSTYRLLLPGDLLQIGYRLHEVLEVVNSDNSGNAAVTIWPSIREATTDGEAITLNSPKGLFRLADNKRSVLSTETRLSGISFQLIEAR